MATRAYHNKCKLQLLERWCQPGSSLLDVGCGRGGDLRKWSAMGLNVTAVEPDKDLLDDAKGRWYKMKCNPHVHWVLGDIRTAPMSEWDCVAYMFSIHWILEDDGEEQFRHAMNRLKSGGVLLGIVPDGDAITKQERFSCPDGQFWVEGDRVNWKVEGPFYNDTVLNEPMLTQSKLQHMAANNGGHMVEWETVGNRSISRFYASFAIMKM